MHVGAGRLHLVVLLIAYPATDVGFDRTLLQYRIQQFRRFASQPFDQTRQTLPIPLTDSIDIEDGNFIAPKAVATRRGS